MAPAALVAAALCITGASAVTLRSEADACQCLNWKETFAGGLVQCGQGFEFTRALGYPEAKYGTAEEWLKVPQDEGTLKFLQGAMGGEFCESFYKRFDDTKCARTAMDSSPTEWYGRSWCYVSKDCGSAMPVAGSQVSAKLCEEGKDSMLSDMNPKELMAYGAKMGFSVPGYFVKVSYPVDRSFFYGEALTSKSKTRLEEIKASGKPVLVDKIDEHQDKMIIVGNETFVVPNSYEGFKCVEGCAEAPEEVYSFAPKDGLICYQGPKDAMTDLYTRVRMGMNQEMFASSSLWATPCKEHGFTIDILGQTCYGNTFVNTLQLKPHVDDEQYYSAKFKQEHTQEEAQKADYLMGCASCWGHC